MKRDGGHRVQRLIMVATSAIIISIGLLITTTVSADESPALVGNDVATESEEQVIVVSQAVTQPDLVAATVSLSGMAAAASSTSRRARTARTSISRTILSKDSTRKCFGSTVKFSIATC